MNLVKVTITGADKANDLSGMNELAAKYPFVEWGILISNSREGLCPRYPDPYFVSKILEESIAPVAGHLCGQWAKQSLTGPFVWALIRNQHFRRMSRIQFNGLPETPTAPKYIDTAHSLACDLAANRINKEFIIQIRSVDELRYTEGRAGVSYLIDPSGGQGITISDLRAAPNECQCGYAGGINVDNIESILESLCKNNSKADFWIDIETGAREMPSDRFDLSKVEKLLRIASGFLGSSCG